MERQPVISSNIVSVGYDSQSLTLEIEFNNGIYLYHDVPDHIYQELINSDSKGSYLHNHIKNAYNHERI